ncbi:MAG: glycosyltransferase [Phycisphaerae bacterium]|nr:glycosyltransferase [Phycisphaerae bacterium]
MRVVLIADEAFAVRERSLLARLGVGMADEGLRVIHALPRAVGEGRHAEVGAEFVLYESRGLQISRGWRAQQLARQIESLGSAEGEPQPGIVHAFGRGAWELAAETAHDLTAALIVEVASAEDASGVADFHRSHGLRGAALAADLLLEERVRAMAPEVAVRTTPWGVHAPAAPRSILDPARAPSLMLLGGGEPSAGRAAASASDRAALAAALDAIARAAAKWPDLAAFAEADAVLRAGLWDRVRDLGLHERLTLVPDAQGRADLALMVDLMLFPQSDRPRSIMLEAMAAGVAVVASPDPLSSVIADGRTARVADSSAAWPPAVAGLLDDPESARALGRSAHHWIKHHRKASAHVAAVIDAYEWVHSPESLRFPSVG